MDSRPWQDGRSVNLSQQEVEHSASRKHFATSLPDIARRTRSTHQTKKSPYKSSNLPKPTSSFKVVQSSNSGHHRTLMSNIRKEEDEKWATCVQQASERRAIDSLNIIKWVSVLSEDQVERQTLKDAALHLKPADYREDVIIERHSNGLCGYPLCQKPPRRQFTASELPQLQICLSQRKVLDVKESGQFCSTICFQRSEWYEKKILGREPEWAKAPHQRTFEIGVDGRSELVQDLKLLEEIEEEQLIRTTATPDFSGVTSSTALDELMAPLLRTAAKEDLHQVLASLTITEHAPALSTDLTQLPLPPSPQQTTLPNGMDADCNPTGLKSKQSTRSVRWADDCALSDNDEPMLEAETFEHLGEMIKQQCVLTGSSAGSFQRRSQTRAQEQSDGGVNDYGDEVNGWESMVVYDVVSEEDRMAIDFAMSLREGVM
ncbi:hypothetical protein CROQUDRAFT_666379 [Cronartium quercuum f. sp. fusiforme G11]|uniref:RNA polymerase II subunit B1 CTD phosphatase RPAP2 homolog n=1 Tax=Cronartium quercuum f. sp. fusiforme G11 TaxID=708437 RepID=A0A9P6N8A2_9BASI|nr:hypothetical protein CROQUDRAFT_666379 [Cronartium quercuum f. sp. fusiforme G11]